jgi:hypothetical protein
MRTLELTNCYKCGGDMPLLRRIKFGYNHCTRCSTVERVGGVPITNHKTGNTLQVVPKDVADNIIRLAQRKGYGVCSGMKHN